MIGWSTKNVSLTFCGSPLLRSLLGVKRTCPFALHMSAFDPKQTWRLHREMSAGSKIGADALEFSLAQLNSGRFHALRFR